MRLDGHTFLISGSTEHVPALLSRLEEEGIATQGNPDVYVRAFAHCGIEEVRDIRVRASTKALSGRRAFIIVAHIITVEAQNALLKTLEEPVEGTLFFIITPSPDTLLPTLRSRAQYLGFEETQTARGGIDVQKFLAAAPAARIDMLKPLLEKGDDDKRDMGSIVLFLSELERLLAPRVSDPAAREGLSAIYRAREYSADKGALLKPLLEQVALLV